ncbi:MAG: TraR/DksA C4-type zinc finger protein [Elusimicrobiota bacterium]|nr:TraR/DksA C4-type zinc finger protein [Elusimicrobiota bacterium]
MYGKRKKNHFKKLLEKLIIEFKAALNSNKDTTETVSLDDSIGRLSRVDALHAQNIAMSLQGNIEVKLKLAHQALEKISKGEDYGICVACNKPIAEARLEVMPETPLCIDCSR